MAGSRKDVELIFRAKDQASKVVDALTDAIDAFSKSQGNIVKDSKGSASALGKLADALGSLDKAFNGLSGVQQIAGKLDKATAAFESQAKTVTDLATETGKLADATTEAGKRTDELRAKTDQATAAQKQQVTAVKAAKQAERDMGAAVSAANAERDKAATSIPRITDQIEKQAGRVEEARARFERLGAQMAQSEKPTATLTKRVESASVSLQNAKARLADLRNGLEAATTSFDQTSAKADRLALEMAEAGAEATQARSKLSALKDTTRQLGEALRASAADESKLKGSVEATSTAHARAVEDLGRAEKAMKEIAEAATAGGAAQTKLAATIRAQLLPEYGRLKAGMAAAEAEQAKFQATARTLAADIGRVGVPTQQMAAAFNNAKVAAGASKQEILAYQVALGQVRNALRGAASGGITYTTATQQIGTASAKLRESLNAIGSNRAAKTLKEIETASSSAGSGMRQAASESKRLEQALRDQERIGRESLSLYQRLRGEVLAFAASYVGFFAAVEGIKAVIDATATLEKAQARLNVAYQGDNKKVASDMDFLRRNAERLGIQFGELANEYTQFAVATAGTNLAGEKTRKIFISVAEAARVNGTSTEDLKGVFTALTQIVSKGAVQMEELRQQLGDRLPGALQLMADGLGVSTAKLIKMMEAGQVSSDALVGFADQLDKKFGPQLAKSLQGVTAETGRFRDALFNMAVVIGNSGFMEKFASLLRSLNEQFRSAEGVAFAQKLGAALGLLTDIVRVAIENFDLLVIAAAAFGGAKLAGQIPAMIAMFTGLVTSLRTAGTAMGVAATGMRTAGTAAGVASAGIGGLTTALKLLTSSTGIGLLVTLVATGIGYWATRADEATVAMTAHQDIVDRVKNEYDKAGRAVDNWAEKIKSVTKLEAEANQRRTAAAAAEARGNAVVTGADAGVSLGHTTGEVRKVAEALRDLQKTYAETGGSLDEFKTKVQALSDSSNDEQIKAYATAIIESFEGTRSFADAATQAELVVKALTGSAKESADAMAELTGNSGKAGAAVSETMKPAEVDTKKVAEAMDKLREAVGVLPPELARLKEAFDLEQARKELLETFKVAQSGATTIAQMIENVKLYGLALAQINTTAQSSLLGVPKGIDQTLALIKEKESFSANSYWDVNHERIGYGSDTVTLADGSVKEVVKGMTVSIADANRDLIRRVAQFQDGIVKKIGADTFSGFGSEQQAVLTSLAYNYGSLPDRVADAIATGNKDTIVAAIRGLGSDNNGINRGRRNAEADIFAGGGEIDTTKQNEAALKTQKDRVEKEREFHEEQAKTIANNTFEAEQKRLENEGQNKQAAINRAINEAELAAKKAGTELTAKEREEITKTTAALFDQNNVKKEGTEASKAAAAAEKQVNDLLAARRNYTAAMNDALKNGDSTKYDEAKTKLAEINTELTAAIDNAIKMWQAVGGPGADTAIAKLESVKVKSAVSARGVMIDWKGVGDQFAGGLTDAIGGFFSAVANGENVADAAKNAFLGFAASFLQEIAKMILKQLILNAISSFFGGGAGVGVAHSGGIVGAGAGSNRTRQVNPAVFAGARRMHSGGIAGVKPDEEAAILQRGEEVITANDPRHAMNGGGGASPAQNLNIKSVLVMDPGMIPDAMSSSGGEKVVLQHIKANASTVKSALGIS